MEIGTDLLASLLDRQTLARYANNRLPQVPFMTQGTAQLAARWARRRPSEMIGGEGTQMIQPDADTAIDRAITGIPGLDAILGGGLPAGHMYLVEGESGAGKTTLGLHFLLAGRQRGESCLWITMSETERELHAAAKAHGWNLDGIHVLNLVLTRQVLQTEEQYSFFSPADVELNDTTRQILDTVKKLRPTRVVFDPFSDIRHLARETLGYRRQILALRDSLPSTTAPCC
jgi:predicted ATP-dependent serine protease